MIRFFDFLAIFVFVKHTEDAEKGVANGAEGFGFLLVLKAHLKLDVLDS
jgi:hypothetical protein